ncbi:diacylglycerol kinase [bacterium]|nr:diacylglycerol kinase [bacterium]
MAKVDRQIYHGQTTKSRHFGDALKHALHGILTAFFLEANVRRQVLVFIVAVVLAVWLNIPMFQLAIVLVASAAVMTMELLNSSLEALADAVHPEYDQRIQKSKDMAAGAVLLVSLAALFVGIAIFGPPLLALL